ncbi:MAG: fibronectin type III domain-containing protein [bacterium]
MKTLNTKVKIMAASALLALAIVALPGAASAHGDDKKGGDHRGVEVSEHAGIKLGHFRFHPLWWSHFRTWFEHKHDTDGTTASKPVISDIDTTDITDDEATITWTTDVNASTLIWYGADASIGTSENPTITRSVAAGKSHSIHLTGLNDGTKYYVIVGSATGAGRTLSSKFSFTTDDDADNDDPTISNISATTGSTSTTITWTTDEPATSKAYYTTNASVDKDDSATKSDNTLTTSHSLHITGLNIGTLYRYIVESIDGSDNKTDSSEHTFTTSS